MEYETPAHMMARLKLGREEFCQRLLTSLLLHAPYPPWNTRSPLAAAGLSFLRELHERNFGAGWPDGVPVFVDEFELPPRHDAERGAAPDYAVLWDDCVWVIELKAEKASHRAAQVPSYFELAHHYYPNARIDLTYITPPMNAPHNPVAPKLRDRCDSRSTGPCLSRAFRTPLVLVASGWEDAAGGER